MLSLIHKVLSGIIIFLNKIVKKKKINFFSTRAMATFAVFFASELSVLMLVLIMLSPLIENQIFIFWPIFFTGCFALLAQEAVYKISKSMWKDPLSA